MDKLETLMRSGTKISKHEEVEWRESKKRKTWNKEKECEGGDTEDIRGGEGGAERRTQPIYRSSSFYADQINEAQLKSQSRLNRPWTIFFSLPAAWPFKHFDCWDQTSFLLLVVYFAQFLLLLRQFDVKKNTLLIHS